MGIIFAACSSERDFVSGILATSTTAVAHCPRLLFRRDNPVIDIERIHALTNSRDEREAFIANEKDGEITAAIRGIRYIRLGRFIRLGPGGGITWISQNAKYFRWVTVGCVNDCITENIGRAFIFMYLILGN